MSSRTPPVQAFLSSLTNGMPQLVATVFIAGVLAHTVLQLSGHQALRAGMHAAGVLPVPVHVPAEIAETLKRAAARAADDLGDDDLNWIYDFVPIDDAAWQEADSVEGILALGQRDWQGGAVLGCLAPESLRTKGIGRIDENASNLEGVFQFFLPCETVAEPEGVDRDAVMDDLEALFKVDVVGRMARIVTKTQMLLFLIFLLPVALAYAWLYSRVEMKNAG